MYVCAHCGGCLSLTLCLKIYYWFYVPALINSSSFQKNTACCLHHIIIINTNLLCNDTFLVVKARNREQGNPLPNKSFSCGRVLKVET